VSGIVLVRASFGSLPVGAELLACELGIKFALDALGVGVMFAVPRFFCRAVDDRHCVGVATETYGAGGKGTGGLVCCGWCLASAKGLRVLVGAVCGLGR
jgi:hypothetical protein